VEPERRGRGGGREGRKAGWMYSFEGNEDKKCTFCESVCVCVLCGVCAVLVCCARVFPADDDDEIEQNENQIETN